jgi:hypothetical protein
MVNPIATGVIALGIFLFLFGIALVVRHRKTVGIAISVLGLAAVAFPLLVSLYLTMSGL